MMNQFNGFSSLAYGALGVVRECTTSEWERDSDGCEQRNLEAYYQNEPPPEMIITTNTSAVTIQNAADLTAAIRVAGGALYIWSSNIAQNSALRVAGANPLLFVVKPGGERGEYIITLKTGLGAELGKIVSGGAKGEKDSTKSQEPLGGYLPYILGGAGILIVLSMLRK